ncbi:MAG: hypothetical protein SGJ27_15325 [Candidatus Melainabacteria bacterium]|nr:hypothetical protein [Candidatus Melainabacteria bacterium]
MASLYSEDQDYKSFFELQAGKTVDLSAGAKTEVWQFYSIKLGHGERTLFFTSPSENKEKYDGYVENVDTVADGYLLCRKSRDEVDKLVKLLERFAAQEVNSVRFEPLEPSFEFILERQNADEIRLSVFVDEGNVLTTIARWDSLGLRFFTNQSMVEQFIQELKRDFAC